MKFVVFGPEARLGLVVGHRILDLAHAAAVSSASARGHEHIFASLLALIESGDRGLDLARQMAERFSGSDQASLYVELATVQLHAPFPGQRLAMAGSNFAAHVANAYTNFGKPTTAAEVHAKTRLQGKAGGFWAVSRPVGTDADIPVPRSAKGLFDYEGEVAIVLAKGGKRIAADRWADRIWGTTLLIDWSVRNHSLSNQRPFYAHKVFDCSKSIGPWIAVDEVDPTRCDVETRVNGEVRQSFNTRDMIYSFGEMLEQIAEDLTLYPGDVLSSGTGAGTAVDRSVPGADGLLLFELFLKAGDLVEVTSPGLGSLEGRVVANA